MLRGPFAWACSRFSFSFSLAVSGLSFILMTGP